MWKVIAKKASLSKLRGSSGGDAAARDAGTAATSSNSSSSTSSSSALTSESLKSLEKKGSAALGPFSLDEFGQLQHLFA